MHDPTSAGHITESRQSLPREFLACQKLIGIAVADVIRQGGSQPVKLDTFNHVCAVHAPVGIADTIRFNQLQTGAEDASRTLIVGAGDQNVAADHGRYEHQRLQLVVIERGFGITLAGVIGVQRPDPIQLSIELLGLLLVDADSDMIDLCTADQAGADHIGAQTGDSRPSDQMVAHGITRPGYQHASLAVVQVAPGTAQSRNPARHAAQHTGCAAPAGFDSATAPLRFGRLPFRYRLGELECLTHQQLGRVFAEKTHNQITM
ncbi:hypothetical protein ALP75_203211 [Pseudomonas syringae pv. actinidiae]|nr:hypothetical protein ALP75_203211 [Pseudomonas syringae pv. actinidiae]